MGYVSLELMVGSDVLPPLVRTRGWRVTLLPSEVVLLVIIIITIIIVIIIAIIIISAIVVIVIVAGVWNPLSLSEARIFGGNFRIPSFAHKRRRRMSTAQS
jgi:hypothetical protein